MAPTGGLGVEVAIEAVEYRRPSPRPWTSSTPGHVDDAGVHGDGVGPLLDKLWISKVTLTTGLVNTVARGKLPKLVAQKKLPDDQHVSRTFDLNDLDEAYDTIFYGPPVRRRSR